jgi:hypothetical protein
VIDQDLGQSLHPGVHHASYLLSQVSSPHSRQDYIAIALSCQRFHAAVALVISGRESKPARRRGDHDG